MEYQIWFEVVVLEISFILDTIIENNYPSIYRILEVDNILLFILHFFKDDHHHHHVSIFILLDFAISIIKEPLEYELINLHVIKSTSDEYESIVCLQMRK